VDAFGPEGGGGSTSTEGAGATGATSSAGGDGVGASGAQSSGGASTGGASAGGAGAGGASSGGASAGGGGSDPSGGGGAGGDCSNQFLRFDAGDHAFVGHDPEFDEANDFAFGARLRVGNHPSFGEPGTQTAGVFGNLNVIEGKGWALGVVEGAVAGEVRLGGFVFVNAMMCAAVSDPLPTGTWVDVRATYKKESGPSDLELYVDGLMVTTTDCGDADTPTFTQDIRFGSAVGDWLSYVGDLDDVSFKDKQSAFTSCNGDTHLRFDFESAVEGALTIVDDCDDTLTLALDAVNTPTLACE
jgi:hypothetical protein